MNPILLSLVAAYLDHGTVLPAEAFGVDRQSWWDVWLIDSLYQVEGASPEALPAAVASLREMHKACLDEQAFLEQERRAS